MCPYDPIKYNPYILGVTAIIIIVFGALGCFLLSGIFCETKRRKRKTKNSIDPSKDKPNKADDQETNTTNLHLIPGNEFGETIDPEKPKPYVVECDLKLPD